jgi:putative peptidoglycan lipid II flippase
MLLAVPCMVVAGVMTAMLQARQRFVFPAFVTSVFNVGLIIGAVVLTPWLGAVALAIGMLIGAIVQIVLQWYGLRDSHIRWSHEWRDPALFEMVRLYAPVALGMGFSALGTIIDRRYASDFGAQVLPTMRYATTLIQFPLGLVAAAISTAILPTLARLADQSDRSEFRAMVGDAINVVIVLIVPASLLLWLVRTPLTSFILERQAFQSQDTMAVANVLTYYIPGLPAAAIDQILLFACYARGRTLAPNIVQGGAIIAYLVAVNLAIPWLGQSAETLAWANSVQWIVHMLLMAVICQRMFDLRGLAIAQTLGLSLMTAAVTWCVLAVFQVLVPMVGWPAIVQLLVLACCGGSTFVAVGWHLQLTPLQRAYELIGSKLLQRIRR